MTPHPGAQLERLIKGDGARATRCGGCLSMAYQIRGSCRLQQRPSLVGTGRCGEECDVNGVLCGKSRSKKQKKKRQKCFCCWEKHRARGGMDYLVREVLPRYIGDMFPPARFRMLRLSPLSLSCLAGSRRSTESAAVFPRCESPTSSALRLPPSP